MGKDEKTGDPGTGDGKILGKFETPDDLATAYTNLEKEFGQKRDEVGQLRQQNEELTAAQQAAADKANAQPDVDFDAASADIQKKIEDGDLSLTDGMNQLMKITHDRTLNETEAKIADYDKEKSAQEMYDGFLKDNPLYTELDEAGELDAAIQANPMHDKFSAYYAIKAERDAKAAADAAREETLKLANGAAGSQVLLDGNGQGARDFVQPRKDLSPSEKLTGMQQALARARSAPNGG